MSRFSLSIYQTIGSKDLLILTFFIILLCILLAWETKSLLYLAAEDIENDCSFYEFEPEPIESTLIKSSAVLSYVGSPGKQKSLMNFLNSNGIFSCSWILLWGVTMSKTPSRSLPCSTFAVDGTELPFCWELCASCLCASSWEYKTASGGAVRSCAGLVVEIVSGSLNRFVHSVSICLEKF